MFLKKILPALQEQAKELGWISATTFQKKMVSRIKSGLSLMALGPEDSGKSAALAVGVLQILKEEEGDTPRAIWLAQSDEEILKQMERFEALGENLSVRVIPATEKGDILKQKDAIYFGSDLVLTTPKRANALLSIEGINMISMRHLFIDSADKLLRNEIRTLCYRVSESMPKAQVILAARKSSIYIERYEEQFMNQVELLVTKDSIKNPECT
jgi:superfamily II DNA/RNA helicase